MPWQMQLSLHRARESAAMATNDGRPRQLGDQARPCQHALSLKQEVEGDRWLGCETAEPPCCRSPNHSPFFTIPGPASFNIDFDVLTLQFEMEESFRPDGREECGRRQSSVSQIETPRSGGTRAYLGI